MALRSDSYSSTSEVKAWTRHLTNSTGTWNSTTQPTLSEVEKFIDRASGVLNTALSRYGLLAANVRANTTAKLACDDWVTAQGAMYVEMTQRGTGYSDQEGSRTGYFSGLYKKADGFASEVVPGFKALGVTVTAELSRGVKYTGETAHADRSDPTDTSLEQPFFKRGIFDATSDETDEEEA